MSRVISQSFSGLCIVLKLKRSSPQKRYMGPTLKKHHWYTQHNFDTPAHNYQYYIQETTQNTKKNFKCWNQHKTMWLDLTSTQRHTRKLNLGHRPAAKTRLLSFNRTQSRVLAFLLDISTWEDIYTYWGWLTVPWVWGVGRRRPQLTSYVILKLWRHTHTFICVPFSWTLRVLSLPLAAIWTLLEGRGFHDLDFILRGTNGLSGAYVHRDQKGSNPR